jgi:quinol monooxygenase YgiN
MIYVIATIELASGRRAEFLQHLQANVPAVLAENGCVEYAPAVDIQTSIPAQGAARPDVVTVIEKWADVVALEAHLIAPHMIVYRAKVKDLVRHVSLQVLESA